MRLFTEYRRDILIYWLILAMLLSGLAVGYERHLLEHMRLLDLMAAVLVFHSLFYFFFIRRHLRELQRHQEEIKKLYEVVTYEISSITASTENPRVLMEKTLDLVLKSLKGDACSIMRLDENEGVLRFEAGRGHHYLPHSLEFKLGEGVAGWVAQEGISRAIADVSKESHFVSAMKTEEIKALLCAPLKSGDLILGVVNVSRRSPHPFSAAEENLLNVIASRAALAMQNTDILKNFEDEKRMLDKILNTASDAIICLDGAKRVLFMNHKGEEITGWSTSDVVGRSFCREVVQVRDSRGHLVCNFDCPLDRACQSPQRAAMSEAILMTKKGQQVWIEHQYSALVNASGRLQFGVLTIRDISGRKRAERLRLQLTSNIVHELKTPLTYIGGYVDLLLMKRMGNLSAEQVKSLEIVKDSVHRLLVLIENLLEVARMEEGRFYLHFGSVSPVDVVRKSSGLARSEAVRKNIELTTVIQNEVPSEIYADAKRLEEVMMNLLSNALKYTQSGGMVEVGVGVDEDYVRFYVRDTGIGISPEDLGNIFSRYAQLNLPEVERPADGAGLGLNIVKRIIEAHGGHISVESELGKGSVFHVRIPKREMKDGKVETEV